jgi:hypothetical protein
VAEPLQALTLVQPFATLVASGVKRVENREWAPPASLRWLAIHAGVTPERRKRVDGWAWAIEAAREIGLLKSLPLLARLVAIPDARGGRFGHAQADHYIDTAVPYGAILAVARVEGTYPRGEKGDPWHFPEQIGWKLAEIVAIEPVPCKGAQGLWPVRSPVLEAVRERFAAARKVARAAQETP